MIPIALIAWSRPQYLRQAVDHLARCEGIADCVLFPQVDPGCDEVRSIVESVDFAECRPTFHRERLGCARNSRSGWDAAFALADFAVLVEEDILLAADSLGFFAHCRDAYRADPGIGSATAYHRRANPVPSAEHHALRRRPWFHSWGAAMWRDRYALVRDRFTPEQGSDGRVLAEFARRGLMEAYPELSRCQNVGVVTSLQQGPQFDEAFYQEFHLLRHWAGNHDVGRGEWREAE